MGVSEILDDNVGLLVVVSDGEALLISDDGDDNDTVEVGEGRSVGGDELNEGKVDTEVVTDGDKDADDTVGVDGVNKDGDDECVDVWISDGVMVGGCVDEDVGKSDGKAVSTDGADVGFGVNEVGDDEGMGVMK